MNSLDSNKKGKRTYKWLLRLAGILLFAYILLYRIDLSDLSSILYKVRIYPLLIAIVLAVPFILLKAARWQLLLKDLDEMEFGRFVDEFSDFIIEIIKELD